MAIYRDEPISLQTGLKPMAPDDIAMARRSRDSWADLFNDMRRNGLVSARSLHHALGRPATSRPVVTPRNSFVLSLGNGRGIAVSSNEEAAATPFGQDFDGYR